MYPIANLWLSIGNASVGTSAAQAVAETDLGNAAGSKPQQLRWICYQPNGDVYFGGPNVTTTTGILLAAGQTLWLEATKGLGLYFVASGTTAMRVAIGVDP
jgi:hypothetical protein